MARARRAVCCRVSAAATAIAHITARRVVVAVEWARSPATRQIRCIERVGQRVYGLDFARGAENHTGVCRRRRRTSITCASDAAAIIASITISSTIVIIIIIVKHVYGLCAAAQRGG